MYEEMDIEYIAAADNLKSMLEAYGLAVELNVKNTYMLHEAIQKEIFIMAVASEKAFNIVRSEYEKQETKSKMSVVKTKKPSDPTLL